MSGNLAGSGFRVSVVIPVFRAEAYVAEAVESALAQPQTGEVILVEDGSPDGSLEVCRELERADERVRLLRHSDGGNHGAAASRNVGIRAASYPYVSFLDADDVYLPGRFSQTEEVFARKQEADGVYEAIGVMYEDDESRARFRSVGLRELTTVRGGIRPHDLFGAFVRGGSGGYFSVVGFTARKEIFDRVACFNERLEMYEDTMLILQLSARCNLLPGSTLAPVALRRVHRGNRITARFEDKRKTYETTLDMWKLFLVWAESNLPSEQIRWTRDKVIITARNVPNVRHSLLRWSLSGVFGLLRLAWDHPTVCYQKLFWRCLLPSIRRLPRSGVF